MVVRLAGRTSMARLFGTDGVRGRANREVTAELALGLAAAAAHVLALSGAFAGHRPRAVVGRDPRASGGFLSAAVCAGLASAGVDVIDVGVLPTPAVAHLTAALDVDLGVMLSASHNPMADNGIKFFSRGGHKLADDVEDAIESRMGEMWDRPTGNDVGRISMTPARLAMPTSSTSSRPCRTRWRVFGSRSTARTAQRARSARQPCVARAPRSS